MSSTITINVATEADLEAAIATVDQASFGNYTIKLTTSFQDTADITAIALQAAVSLTIDGGVGANQIDANGHRGLFVYAGRVTIRDSGVVGAVAAGGTGGSGPGGGGGGGAGLGGGLFVGAGAAVTLDNGLFTNDSAVGGAGGNVPATGSATDGAGGGGGMGGAGGSGTGGLQGGGGGIGSGAFGGSNGLAGGPGIVPGPSGTTTDGGGGKSGAAFGLGGGQSPNQGNGGFGGGGGGGAHSGQNGGFGGGGGAGGGTAGSGGNGGFGGGAGGNSSQPGGNTGLAGEGGGGALIAGGGGLGAGGAIFVQSGGTLTIDATPLSGGGTLPTDFIFDAATAGAGGTATVPPSTFSGSPGSASGSDIFLQGNQTLTLNAQAGQTIAFSDGIADETSLGGANTAGVVIEGSGDIIYDVSPFYSGSTTVSGNANLDVASAVVFKGSLGFAAGSHGDLNFSVYTASQTQNSPVKGFTTGETIDLENINAIVTSVSATGSTLMIPTTLGSTAIVYLDPMENYTNLIFALSTSPRGGTRITPELACFAQGTRIATPSGERLVEALAAGDRVLTLSGRYRPVIWTGRREVDCDVHPNPRSVWPVRVRANAFGPGLPCRDLFLSPDHAVFLAGALIPVKQLIDDDAVAQTPVGQVAYFHVELDAHDVLLAERLPCESYLDTGDRGSFTGDPVMSPDPGPGADTHSRHWDAFGCAPLHLSGPAVASARAQLANVGHASGSPYFTVGGMAKNGIGAPA